MIIQWHLLAEQLQQHPEQVEEALQDDVLALAGQAEQGRQQAAESALPQEQDVLRRLQSQLGNFALQQLLKPHPPASPAQAEPTEKLPVPEQTPVPEKTQSQGKPPLLEKSPTSAQPVREKPAIPKKPALDPARRAALLLRQILIALPDLPVAMLTELARLVEEQAPELKAGIVDTMARRINSLTPAAREELMRLIDRLPRSLTSGALMAALLARLLVTTPPAPPPEPAPAPPEA